VPTFVLKQWAFRRQSLKLYKTNSQQIDEHYPRIISYRAFSNKTALSFCAAIKICKKNQIKTKISKYS
jgi:hypothetical protein